LFFVAEFKVENFSYPVADYLPIRAFRQFGKAPG
jgi:hypothetical protein